MQRTLLGSVANSSDAAVRSHGMLLDDVVLDAGAIPLVVAAPSMAGSRVAVDRIARNDGVVRLCSILTMMVVFSTRRLEGK